MLCPTCAKVFQTFIDPSHFIMLNACQAYDKGGNVAYDERNTFCTEAIHNLELKGYIISTETGEYQIDYCLNHKTVLYVDPGYFCWCHLHVESNDERL